MPISKNSRRSRMAGNPLAALGMRAGYNSGRERAEALAVSRSHLMHIERGAIWPSETIIARMAAVYDRPEEMIVRAARLARRRLGERMIEQATDIE